MPVSITKDVQTYSLVWSFLTPVKRLECHNLNPRGRTAILTAFPAFSDAFSLQRSHMRRRLTAVSTLTHTPINHGNEHVQVQVQGKVTFIQTLAV